MLSEVTIYNLSEFDKWFLNQEVIEVLKEIDKEMKKKLPNFEITNIKFVYFSSELKAIENTVVILERKVKARVTVTEVENIEDFRRILAQRFKKKDKNVQVRTQKKEQILEVLVKYTIEIVRDNTVDLCRLFHNPELVKPKDDTEVYKKVQRRQTKRIRHQLKLMEMLSDFITALWLTLKYFP